MDLFVELEYRVGVLWGTTTLKAINTHQVPERCGR
jgi:hypothetical protein